MYVFTIPYFYWDARATFINLYELFVYYEYKCFVDGVISALI